MRSKKHTKVANCIFESSIGEYSNFLNTFFLKKCSNYIFYKFNVKSLITEHFPIFSHSLTKLSDFSLLIVGWANWRELEMFFEHLTYKSKHGVCLCGQKLGTAWKILSVTARSLWSFRRKRSKDE